VAGDTLPRREARPVRPDEPTRPAQPGIQPRDSYPRDSYPRETYPMRERSEPRDAFQSREAPQPRYTLQPGEAFQAREAFQPRVPYQPREYPQPQPQREPQPGFQPRLPRQQGFPPPQPRLWETPPPDGNGRPPRQPLDFEEPGFRPAGAGRGAGHAVWQVARVGIPVVGLLAVGLGALAMLTGKAHEAMQDSGSQSATTPSATASATARASATSVSFPGYAAKGIVQVTSIAGDGSAQVAVGSADGHAGIWHRTGGGTWTLVKSRPVVPLGTVLTSVAHGPDGWLAVGNLSRNGLPTTASLTAAGKQPVILTSADGVTWKLAPAGAFAGAGLTVNAVAASARGYVVVGEQVQGGVPKDAMWFSPNMAAWARGGDIIASTVSSISSGMSDSKIFAVAATATGFVAVGTHNGCHTAWVSADGQHWSSYDIPKPTGSMDPLLNRVAVMGSTVVAAGDLGVGGGRIPLIVMSKDGGLHWQGTPVGGYGAYHGPQGTVTALASDGSGFLAAGLVGPPGAQHAVTWTSPDGITWSGATPATGGAQQITALDSAGGGPVSSIASVTARFGTQAVEVSGPRP
jgi:hypothetical protein